MDRIYKIGSFNLNNIGPKARNKGREFNIIADIIRKEEFDIVALQEVLSEGKAFIENDSTSSFTKSGIISYLGGSEKWGFEWASSGDDSNRHEGYAFLWNKKRLRLSSARVIKGGVEFDRIFNPRMLKINRKDMKRQPFYARFTPQGMPGGSSFEIRIICVHTYYGKDSNIDREIRQNELDILFDEVYPQISERVYGNGFPNYTILLGDYNAELLTKYSIKESERINRNLSWKPATIRTDNEGIVYSNKYDVSVKTFQEQLTTLKTKKVLDSEEFDGGGYASNYDHFSYDESRVGEVIGEEAQRIDAVSNYCDGDFLKYLNTVSDHVPIVLELNINKNQLDVRGLEE